jgi:putative ABC transport system permease protein
VSLWRQIARGLRALTHRSAADRDVGDEVQHYLEQATAAHLARGLSPEAALRAARLELGSMTSVREEVRSSGWEDLVATVFADLRYASRRLRSAPGFAVVTVLTLGLGIGATTAIFTVLNGLVFRPLPFREPKRLVMIWETNRDYPQILVSYPNYLDWHGRLRAFEDVALYDGFAQFTLTGKGDAERVRGGRASGNLFDVLGVGPALGRLFRSTDDRVGAERVAVVTDAFWRRTLAADPGAVGSAMTLDGFSYTIVGVLPPRVQLARSEVWVPMGLFANTEAYTDRSTHPGTIGIGRLKRGMTLDRMQADLDQLYRQLVADHPAQNAGIGASGGWLLDQVLGGIRPALYILAGAVGLVLLIACANVASLLLGRAASRQREIALRTAIGAHRSRIVRQLLTESMLLSGLGAALGVALAWGGVRLLVALQPGNLPRLVDIRLDGPVLAFAAVLSVLTGIAFGLVPALQTSRGDLVAALRDGGRGATAGPRPLRMRRILLVGEMALALVLLVGAGLLIRSFAKLTSVDLGVDPRNVTVGLVSLPERNYPDAARQTAVFADLLERVGALPQVTDAALATDLPVNSSWQSGVTFEGLPPVERGREPLLNAVVAAPGWFSTMKMRVLAGRGLESTDRSGLPPVLVISQAVAKRFFAGESPVGRRMKMGPAAGGSPWLTIVGVVNDVKQEGPSVESRGAMYLPLAQNPSGTLWLAVRSSAQAAGVVPALRAALTAIDPDVPLSQVQTLEERVAGTVAQPRFSMLLLSLFAAIALVLAAIGIYGVISYSVALRTHEIGVRIALGARPRDVLGMVVRQVFAITGLGIALGGAGALAAGSLLTRLLFGVQSSDPTTFVAVSMVLAAVALLAAAVPARRAARLDPVAALREN